MNGESEAGLFFLPSWPPSPDAVFWVATTLVAAALLGEFVFRRLRLPRIVGYTVVGALIGAAGFGVAGAQLAGSLRLVVDLALALLLFELGSRVNLRWLKANPWLLATSLAEAALTFVTVMLVLGALGVAAQQAAAIAAIAMCTSPSVVMRVTSEFNASGQVTERTMLLSALNMLYAVLATKLLTGWLHHEYAGSLLRAILHPLYLLAGSALIAALLGLGVSQVARRLDLRNENSTLLLLGLILLALAVTKLLALSTLMVPLIAGLILRNSTERPWIWPRHFGTAGGVLVLLLFVVTGTSWSPQALASGALLGLAAILARGLAKSAAVLALARPSGASLRQGLAVGAALTPLSGGALVLVAELQALYPEFGAGIAATALSMIAVLELVGPIAVHAALRHSKEENVR